MKLYALSEMLWGKDAKLKYLFIAGFVMLLTLLGARDIWTQEHRWADIVVGMLTRQDFLHPYLDEQIYYDKPLLSYWLIIAAAKITGILNAFILRLPSALAGVLALWSIYQIGLKQKSREVGLLAAWLLLTTYYFVFWARVSSADMLNLGGSLFAIAWYLQKKTQISFFNYVIFFIILAVTSLCKGLIGAIVPMIAVFIDICLQRTWRLHLRPMLFLALIPAIIIYLIPFLLSGVEEGLYLVYRENVLRYFEPFDHRGPFYTYLIYLPIYLLPWTFLFLPALWFGVARFKQATQSSRWILLCLAAIFLFFSLSGSRRSYYVLPMVPFAILLTADWLLAGTTTLQKRAWVAGMLAVSFMLIFISIVLLPAWYYANDGVSRFVYVFNAA